MTQVPESILQQQLQDSLKVQDHFSTASKTQINPFEGIEGLIDASKIKQEEHFKIAILGRPKTGKSWFACTAPGTKLVYDFDDRAISLAGKLNTMVRTLRDTLTNPFAVKALETDISNFKYKKLKGLPIPETYIFDTISNFISNGLRNDYLLNNPKDGRRIKLGGSSPVQIGTSYDLINTSTGFLDYLLSEYYSLGNVIFVFHEKDEKDKKESKKDDPKYTGLITIEPQFAANILTLFNEVFRIEVKGSAVANSKPIYTVYCRATNEVTASTTLLLDAEEPPDIMQMIRKHRERKSQLASVKE